MKKGEAIMGRKRFAEFEWWLGRFEPEIQLNEWQIEMAKVLLNDGNVLINAPRQCGKSTLVELLHKFDNRGTV